ncbi:CD151 antigen-like [Bolinopsis microptera]|uniref:CD151 antigen-like n=1 Tax=Bolinopsis microptera TaxID=2820187 RepID=UPI0030795458
MGCFVLGCIYNITIVILSACGMLLIGSAVYMLEMFPQYGSEQDITDFTIVTIVVGCVTLAAGIVMCVAMCTKHRCMLYVVSLASVVLFCFQISSFVWIATQSQTEKVGKLSMASYEKQPQFFDRVQVDFDCCGINEPSDWASSTWGESNPGKVPGSCCAAPELTCDLNSENMFTVGCQRPLFLYMETMFNIITIAMLVTCVFQFATIFISCCVARAFKEGSYDSLSE